MGRQTRLNRICNAGNRDDKAKKKSLDKIGNKLDTDSVGKYAQSYGSNGKKLAHPIVVSKLGRLYNKDLVIKHLLAKHEGIEKPGSVDWPGS